MTYHTIKLTNSGKCDIIEPFSPGAGLPELYSVSVPYDALEQVVKDAISPIDRLGRSRKNVGISDRKAPLIVIEGQQINYEVAMHDAEWMRINKNRLLQEIPMEIAFSVARGRLHLIAVRINASDVKKRLATIKKQLFETGE